MIFSVTYHVTWGGSVPLQLYFLLSASCYCPSVSGAWIPSGTKSLIWCDLLHAHLGLITHAWFDKRGKRRWMDIPASGSLMQDYCPGEWLWHVSLGNPGCDFVGCWAVIKRRSDESTHISPRVSDEAAISIQELWRTADFLTVRQVERRIRSDLSNTNFEKLHEPADLHSLMHRMCFALLADTSFSCRINLLQFRAENNLV